MYLKKRNFFGCQKQLLSNRGLLLLSNTASSEAQHETNHILCIYWHFSEIPNIIPYEKYLMS